MIMIPSAQDIADLALAVHPRYKRNPELHWTVSEEMLRAIGRQQGLELDEDQSLTSAQLFGIRLEIVASGDLTLHIPVLNTKWSKL
jgi:hypothetical protein